MSEEQRRIQKGETSYQPLAKKFVYSTGQEVREPDYIEQSILDKIDALQKSVDKLQSTVDGMTRQHKCECMELSAMLNDGRRTKYT